MKKTLLTGVVLLLWTALAFSQSALSHSGRFYLGVQGGPLYNLYENQFSYWENDYGSHLFTLQGGVVAGYDLNDTFGIRLSGSYGKNAGAGNVRETAGDGFYPYTFYGVNVFADAVLNLSGLAGKVTAFRPKVYAGLGGAYTFNFTDPHHPWQKVTDGNTVLGFRFGFISEYSLNEHFGIYADLCGEAYTDKYNGLMPNNKEQEWYEGYGGFPLDLRALVSLGVLYRF